MPVIKQIVAINLRISKSVKSKSQQNGKMLKWLKKRRDEES